MQEEKQPQQSFVATVIVDKNESLPDGYIQRQEDTKACELGLKIAEFFEYKKVEENDDQAIYELKVVVMTQEEFDNLKETEWKYKDLADEE